MFFSQSLLSGRHKQQRRDHAWNIPLRWNYVNTFFHLLVARESAKSRNPFFEHFWLLQKKITILTCLSFWPSQKRCHTVPLTLSCCATYVPWINCFCLLNLCCSHGCSWSRIQWYHCGGALCTAQFQVPQSCGTCVGRRGSELEFLSACLPAVTRKLC